MARSLSQSKRFAVLVSDVLNLPLLRRGYAAAVSDGFGAGRSRSSMVEKLDDSLTRQSSEASSAWVPDPITGYYRPVNHASEIDPAELRHTLLNHKLKSSH